MSPEAAIRILGVSLIAIAAIAATMSVARQRAEHRPIASLRISPGDAPLPLARDKRLDAIRTAGF